MDRYLQVNIPLSHTVPRRHVRYLRFRFVKDPLIDVFFDLIRIEPSIVEVDHGPLSRKHVRIDTQYPDCLVIQSGFVCILNHCVFNHKQHTGRYYIMFGLRLNLQSHIVYTQAQIIV